MDWVVSTARTIHPLLLRGTRTDGCEFQLDHKTAPKRAWTLAFYSALALAAVVLVWLGFVTQGNPDPMTRDPGSLSAILDIGVLVFREGLECILVLAAITAV